MKTAHVIVKGLVQGVCFRDYTRREAENQGLVGWVRNLPDGTVETIIHGTPEKIEKMLKWLQKGSPHAVVESLEISEIEQPELYNSFAIRF